MAALNEAVSGVTVVASCELADGDPEAQVALHRWQALAEAALRTEGVVAGELNLLFIDEPAMTELNVMHMEGTGPTDVLAFPIDGEDIDAPAGTPVPVLLGDVVVCPAVARRNAGIQGHDFQDEVALLVIHGVLHVLGHDHVEPDETARMKDRERDLLFAHYSR